jgi:UDP-N-acetylmuramate--alanine ligase
MELQPGAQVHIVGVGGVGMSALAQILVDLGYRVTGSDRFLDQGETVPVFAQLEAAGVKFLPQDGSGVRTDTACIAVSTAIEEQNPELVAGRDHAVPVVHRASLLASLCGDSRVVAVSGTAGKTTVTGMIGWIFDQIGLDPTVVNGGGIVNWITPERVASVKKGAGRWWIVEADESDRSLLEFTPDVAVITNASKDHFALEEVYRIFAQFAARSRGPVVVGPGLAAIPGLENAEEAAGRTEVIDGSVSLVVGDLRIPVPLLGAHNGENARIAVAVCRSLGCSLKDIAHALKSFRGIERRLEIVGKVLGSTVIDEYAHNPSKISAAWSTVAELSPRIFGVWRPHGFGPLALMFDELVDAFCRVCRTGARCECLCGR